LFLAQPGKARADASKRESGKMASKLGAAGGEIKPGCEDFVKRSLEDPMETVMHVSTTKGDMD
jgi:hypothetical protein